MRYFTNNCGQLFVDRGMGFVYSPVIDYKAISKGISDFLSTPIITFPTNKCVTNANCATGSVCDKGICKASAVISAASGSGVPGVGPGGAITPPTGGGSYFEKLPQADMCKTSDDCGLATADQKNCCVSVKNNPEFAEGTHLECVASRVTDPYVDPCTGRSSVPVIGQTRISSTVSRRLPTTLRELAESISRGGVQQGISGFSRSRHR